MVSGRSDINILFCIQNDGGIMDSYESWYEQFYLITIKSLYISQVCVLAANNDISAIQALLLLYVSLITI